MTRQSSGGKKVNKREGSGKSYKTYPAKPSAARRLKRAGGELRTKGEVSCGFGKNTISMDPLSSLL